MSQLLAKKEHKMFSAMSESTQNCVQCGASSNNFHCSRCKKVFYCGKKCQRDHWEVHKLACVSTTTTKVKSEPKPEPKEVVKAEAEAKAKTANVKVKTEKAPKPAQQEERCASCGSPASGNKCGSCKSVSYCGRDCQRAHWPTHKAECKPQSNSNSDSNNSSNSSSSGNSGPVLLVRDLMLNVEHTGACIEGVVSSDPFTMSATHFDLRDAHGDRIVCSVYDYGSGGKPAAPVIRQGPIEMHGNKFGLKKGQRVRITNPWCKTAMDGQTIIRVEQRKDLQILS